ncbi:5'-nucleotidase C-terminal domain-containing protein [Saprospiraceae bacterium]|nr:5'-nucleotidase C-terminal domain-containing protein [Saprospiraceae bacterium]
MYRTLIFSLWVLLFSSCKSATVQHVSNVDVTYLRTESSITIDESSETESIIKPYRDQLSEEMDQVIGMMPEELKKEKPNSNMGNWFSDVLQDIAAENYDRPIAFAIQNYGGLRVPSVAKGPLTRGKIFELMPFDNKLVVLELTGAQVNELANLIARSRGWPISRGLSLTLTNDNSATDVKVDGQLVDVMQNYAVALPDYVANGGGGGDFLKEIPQHDTGFYIREGVIDYLERMQADGKPLSVDHTERIKN